MADLWQDVIGHSRSLRLEADSSQIDIICLTIPRDFGSSRPASGISQSSTCIWTFSDSLNDIVISLKGGDFAGGSQPHKEAGQYKENDSEDKGPLVALGPVKNESSHPSPKGPSDPYARFH